MNINQLLPQESNVAGSWKLRPVDGIRYGSVFWLAENSADNRSLTVTIGWSLPKDHPYDYLSKAWQFNVDSLPETDGWKFWLPGVEEPLGVAFAEPSEAQYKTNEHCERLIADYLLLFAHKALFRQCEKTLPYPDDQLQEVDTLLVWGPTLPKFVGRVCYSHFSRSKTIAVISPRPRTGLLHAQTGGDWNPSSSPPLWEDASVRAWFRNEGAEGVSKSEVEKIASYELIVPTGDGITNEANLSESTLFGQKMWDQKRAKIEEIIDEDDPKSTAIVDAWQGRKVRLPLGLAHAVRVAYLTSLNCTAKRAIEKIAESGSEGSGNRRVAVDQLKKRIYDGNAIDVNLKEIVLWKAFECWAEPKSAGNTSRMAARPIKSLKDAQKVIDQAIGVLVRQYGNFIFGKTSMAE